MKEEISMATTLAQVEQLNNRIEKLNTDRTKTETRKEVLMQNLDKLLDSYAKDYGIDLRGQKFSETYKKIQAEAQKVSADIQEEYSLKEKVVSAIESGDIDEANELLGISQEEDEEPEEEVVDEEVAEEEGIKEESEKVEEPEEEEDEEEEDFGIPEEETIPSGMSPVEEAVKGMDEGASSLNLGGYNMSDILADEDEDEDDDDDDFTLGDFIGEQFK